MLMLSHKLTGEAKSKAKWGNCKRRKRKMETESGNGKRKQKRKAEKGQGRHCNTYNVIVRHARPG